MDDDYVDGFFGGSDCFDGVDVGVEGQFFVEGDNGGGVFFDGGGGGVNSIEKIVIVVLESLDGFFGQSNVGFFKGFLVGVEVDKVEFQIQRGREGFEDMVISGDDFFVDVIIGDEVL